MPQKSQLKTLVKTAIAVKKLFPLSSFSLQAMQAVQKRVAPCGNSLHTN